MQRQEQKRRRWLIGAATVLLTLVAVGGVHFGIERWLQDETSWAIHLLGIILGVLLIAPAGYLVLRHSEQMRQMADRRLADLEEADRALRESERKYRDLVETSQDLIWQCDAEGRFTYLNPAWEKTHGYRVAEMLGRPFSDFQRPEVFARDMQEFSRHMAGGSVRGYETKHLAKDGHEIHLLFNAAPLKDGEGRVVGTQGTAVDISALCEADRAIRDNERLFRNMLRLVPCGVFSVDLQGRIVMWNDAAERITGFPQEEILGKPCTVFCLHESDCLLFGPDAAERRDGIQRQIRTRDGQIRAILKSVIQLRNQAGEVTGGLECFLDITERQAMADQLAEQRRMLADVLESTLAGYWDWNMVRGEEYLSPAFKQMFGYADDELANRPESWQRLVAADDLQRLMNAVDAHVRSHGRVPFSEEVRFRHRDGSTVWVTCAGRVVEWDENGNPVRMVGCHVDITPRKRIEDAIRQLIEISSRVTGDEFHEAMVVQMARCLGADCTLIGVLAEEGGEAVVRTLALTVDGVLAPNMSYALSGTPCENVMGRKLCSFTSGVARLFPRDGMLTDYGFEGYVGMPLQDARRQTIGVAVALFKKPLLSVATAEAILPVFAARIAQEIERTHAERELLSYQRRLQKLASTLSTESEKERHRLASELHDGIGQVLSISKLRVEACRKALTEPRLITMADEVLALLGRGIDDTRSLMFELSPPILYELGLEPAVEWLAEEFEKRHGLAFIVEAAQPPLRLRGKVRALLFQSIRELMLNVVKHAQAATAWIRFGKDVTHLWVEVADDGCGFAVTDQALAGAGFGFGLFAVRERMNYAGGRLDVSTRAGGGARVVLSLPAEMDVEGDDDD